VSTIDCSEQFAQTPILAATEQQSREAQETVDESNPE
jgi:hypothetical protein